MKHILENRSEKLRAALRQAGLDAALLHQPHYIFHLTGWTPPTWAEAALIVGMDGLWLASPFYPGEAEPAYRPAEHASAALGAAQARTVGAVLSSLPAAAAAQLPGLSDITGLMQTLTAVKDEAALAEIRRRVGFLDAAFETVQANLRPGLSEVQVWALIYSSLIEQLGAPLTLNGNLGSGPRSSMDEPEPTARTLEPGDVIMIDLYPQLGGYVADYTRNFVLGQPTDAQRAQHAALEQALKAAEALLRPGVRAAEVDRAARAALEQAGQGQFAYKHHTGHALGLITPEAPWLVPDDQTELQAGMVIAVEPGIYHPQHGGMRLEGNYIITADGPEALVRFPAELIICT